MKAVVATLLLLLFVTPVRFAVAGEKPETTKPSAGPDSTAADAAAKKDPFEIPDGSPQELLDYIAGLQKLSPTESTRAGLIEHSKKVLRISLVAADKIVASKPDAAIEAQAQHIRIEALWAVPRIAGPSAFNGVIEECTKLTNHKRPDVALDAKVAVLGARLIWARAADDEDPKTLIDQLADLIAAGPLDNFNANAAALVASRFMHGTDDSLTIYACRKLADALDKHPNEQIARLTARFRATADKLALIGHPIEITGVTASGEPFDWAKYKGKVVLIDFWATWCGPCVAELPNVKDTYEKFHDKGFEIVGVSLDKDRSRLEKFLEGEKIAWTTLVGPDTDKLGWNHPLAVRYGISSIPATIMVNRQGNVVSFKARGEELPKLVAELLDEKAEK